MLVRFFNGITSLSLRFRWVAIALALLILALGIVAVLGLNLELLPRIEFPQTIVVAQWDDAESAEQFLQEVTIPIENALSAVDGVVNVESTTSTSFAFIIARNDFGLDQTKIFEEIEESIKGISFPEGMELPEILNFSLSDLPVVVASASSSELSLAELKDLVITELQPRLENVGEIDQVTVGGGQELPDDSEPGDSTGEEAPAERDQEEESAIEEELSAEDPGRLPQVLVDGAAALGIEIEYAQDVTLDFLAALGLRGSAEEFITVLVLIPPDTLRFAPPETLALLPIEFVSRLDPALQEELDELAAEFGGINQYTAEETLAMLASQEEPAEELQEGRPGSEIPTVDPVPLPESWIAAVAQGGLTIETTADLTPEIMVVVTSFAPQLLLELEPVMLRAIDPAAVAVVIEDLEEQIDSVLLGELLALQAAALGQPPEPQPLPESWVQTGAAVGFPIENTDDVPAEAVPFLAENAPELFAELIPEVLLAFTPEVLAGLPQDYVDSLDEGLQQTLLNIAIHHQVFLALEEMGEEEAAETEEPAGEDPARLPEALIELSGNFGFEIEFAYDIPPAFMRQITSFGPQGLQVLQMLTPGNLRALLPEAIALLPLEFLASLDPELLSELDELAAEYGGAGQLALSESEAEEEVEVDPDAPLLSGVWLEPNADGQPSDFETAADILNNPFAPGAAMLLNFFPDSPQIENFADFMMALTPDVVAYLADNEEDFVSLLSPVVLEVFSPESLLFLLENYGDDFDADQAERLRAIAAGELDVFVPESTITRTDGNPSVLLNLFKEGDANTVEVANRVFDELAAYETENPEIQISFVFEQASFIEDSITNVAREGLLGAFFAMVVVLIFLSGVVGGRYKLNWRATLVVGVSIPLSIFAALILMRWLPPTMGAWINDLAAESGSGVLAFVARFFPRNITLNIMTLSGMTVAVGRVVDDSIVVLENSYRYIQQGGDRRTAVLNGTREVAIAIFASTLTTVAVFLPLGLTGGIIGSFFLPFGMTVTFALIASFVVAITVVPALTFTLISKKHIPEEKETWMQRSYTPPLEWVLNHRGITMAIASVIFIGSLFLLSTLPRSFIPGLGEPTVNVAVNLGSGTVLAETDALVREFEESVIEIEGIDRIQTEVGSGGGFEAFFGGSGVSQGQANTTISVEDPDLLSIVNDEVRNIAQEIFGMPNVTVSAAVQTGFGGFSLIVTADSLDQLLPVVDDVKNAIGSVDLDEDGRPEIVNITSNVDQGAIDADSTIIRIDGRSAISFGGELETDDTLGAIGAAKEAVGDLETLPANAEVTEGFDSEQQTEGFQQMITAIGYSIILVYLIMAITFKSVIHPFTILLSLPFALVGAALALWLTDSVLGISSMIGMMMLVGIVVTNAIVLLALVQQLRSRGSGTYDALVQGGRTRLRPIWMTALTTTLALIPLALSQEAGAIIASDLAITVIGGLLVSTFLTLLVVPVVYSLFNDLGQKLRIRRK